MVNSIVAHNTVTAALSGGSGVQGGGNGGGIFDGGTSTATFDNNTITQNTINGVLNIESGIAVLSGNPTLRNNLIQDNQNVGSSAHDLNNATNNFTTSISANAVSTTSNIVGNSQKQLGSVVGINATGQPTSGPIYYPLSPYTVSIGYGTTGIRCLP
jgi:hypothetical protein